ncbi:cuticle protein 18.6-like [Varroa jacobsoni]|uniref:cuticle protein 18.6-like n=1 Tax=Varroa jacobsoni TaxID=62625 RepID=UPI000BF2ADD7|nr:cuticle protein 18.6-like [Varroa jacobsoni]
MSPLLAVVLLLVTLVASQQVKSFYSGPIASYSTKYSLGGAQYVPYKEQTQSAYVYKSAPVSRRFEPSIAAREVPAEVLTQGISAAPAFSGPTTRTRYFSAASIGANAASFRPASVSDVAVPAYPVSADVRVANPVRIASGIEDRINYPPTPYAFEYSVNSAEGGQSRTERADGAGRVTGSYTIQLADGRNRVVEYIADEGGYRANIKTNEFGTESQSPANVAFLSSAIPAREAVLLGERDVNFRKYGPSHHRQA